MVLLLLAGVFAQGHQVTPAHNGFSPRPATPRIAPIGTEGRTEAQQKMLGSRPDYNIYKTLAHDPELYARWSALGAYLLNASTLPPRDREMVILRMGWLCQAPYEWSQHARIAKASAQLTDAEIHRIALGGSAPGWSEFDRQLLRMVDELRYQAMLSDATWTALRSRYSLEQMLDAIFTAGQYQLVSMALNSAGVQLDPELDERLPNDVPLPTPAQLPRLKRLITPRVPPLVLATMSEEQRGLVNPQLRDGAVPNLYATLVVHPKFYEPRMRFGSYLQKDSKLQPRVRELAILRTAWLSNTEYEWRHHAKIAQDLGFTDAEIVRVATGAPAQEWTEQERAVLLAADELRTEAFIGDATWQRLARHFTAEQLLELIYTVGGYGMTALAINSLGIQTEPGYPAMPAHP
jgi:4-carboxymuconolactone decarboxylase